MPNEPIISITVGPLPDVDALPANAKAELLARIAFACDWSPQNSPMAQWPKEIKVYVEVYTEDGTPEGVDYHELHNLYMPANGHGFFSSDQWNNVWFQVGCAWDDESSSTINRDFYGTLQHWM